MDAFSSLPNLHSFFGGLICFMFLNPIYTLMTPKGILPVWISLILALHTQVTNAISLLGNLIRHLNLKWVELKPRYSL